jgi:hypothetical protein
VFTRTTGDAQGHLRDRINNDQFTTANEVLQALDAVYGDPHQAIKAEAELQRLGQTLHGSFHLFFVDFLRIVRPLRYDDNKLKDSLVSKLNDKYLTSISAYLDLPYTQLVEKLHAIDKRYESQRIAREGRKQLTASSQPPKHTDKVVQDQPQTPVANAPITPRTDRPAIRSRAEFEALHQAGLCKKCVKPSHTAAGERCQEKTWAATPAHIKAVAKEAKQVNNVSAELEAPVHDQPKKLDTSGKDASEATPRNDRIAICSVVEGTEDSLFTYPCTIGNTNTPLTALIDTCAMGGNFIHFQTAQVICKINDINLKTLRKPISIKGFNGQSAPSITHRLVCQLTVGRHYQPTCEFLVTDLGNNDLIIGNKWLKEHGAISVPVTQEIWFIGDHCRYIGSSPAIDPLKITERKEQATTVQEEPPIQPKKILKRKHSKSLTPNQKLRKQEQSRVEIATTPFRRSQRCTLPTVVEEDEAIEYYESYKPVLSQPKQIALIGPYAMKRLLRTQGCQVMAISMQDIMAQHAKDEVEEQDVTTLLPTQWKNLAEAFSGKAANVLPPHREGVDHHIELEPETKPNWVPRFYRSTREELDEVKKWVTENLSRGFIESSKAPWASPIMFVKKPGGGIRLCIDYRQLNAITKKDRYPIPLIEETMAQIAGCKIMTKLDIRKAFNRIRIATPEDEDLLSFCTPLGNYKPKVLQFGPTNGPASFQRFINNTLFEYLNVFCTAYMDDILIYSQSQEEHNHHVSLVLQRLLDAGLQADISKSEFNVTRTKYLGLIVSTEGIEVDPEKVKVVEDWKTPTSVTEAQSFIGFCSYYRRFIRGFSKVARPIIELTKDEYKRNFKWNDHAQEAFERLKVLVTTAPILIHFDHTKTAYLEADSSDFVQGGCLSQMKDGVLHPVAFFSRKLTPAECNYEIYDKELLAIISALEQWRPELEGTELPIQVLTDHKALEYFMTTKKLTRRQARWALTLSKYNFQITYRPGKQNGKADALTRKPGDRPEGDNDERQQHQYQTILPARRLHPELQQSLEALVNSLEVETQPITIAPVLIEEGQVDEEDDELPELLETRVRAAQLLDETCIRVLKKLAEGVRKDQEVTLAHATVQDNALFIDDKLWVPESIRTEVIQAVHDSSEVGHPGLAKTLFHLKKSYYWPNMHSIIAQFIRNCHTCKRTKTSRESTMVFLTRYKSRIGLGAISLWISSLSCHRQKQATTVWLLLFAG